MVKKHLIFKLLFCLFLICIAVLMIVPFQVTLLPHYALSNLLGMYDTSAALILPSAFAPIPVFLMAQTVKYVPDEIIEAARLETGSTTRILVHIITPSVLPGAVCTAVLFFADTWNQVAEPRILMETEDKLPLAPILHALSDAEPVAYAAAVVFLLGPLLLQLLFSEQLTEGLGYVQINKR